MDMDKRIEERKEENEERKGHRSEQAGTALLLLSPVLSYVMFELVTGNLATVLPMNAVLNIAWMFALYLLVFGISGSTRISIPVASLLLYVISLAEAFVVSFRSRPIMVCDVLAVKTAMTVAGSYHYTPTPDHMECAGAACLPADKGKEKKDQGLWRFCGSGRCVCQQLLYAHRPKAGT